MTAQEGGHEAGYAGKVVKLPSSLVNFKKTHCATEIKAMH